LILRIFAFADGQRESSEFVAGGINAFRGHHHGADGSFDHGAHGGNALDDVVAAIDETGNDFRIIDVSAGPFSEVGAFLEQLIDQLIFVVDQSHRGHRIDAEPRTENQRLRRIVINGPDAEESVHFFIFIDKTGFELNLGHAVHGLVKSLGPEHRHARVFRSQMRMVIGPVKKRFDAICR
jgi:hypothetical protein